ncbi:hypothetical protein [Halococcus sp. IIIV-5B]|uniref:hypothetical protein n=1 Tax=Halococcus sp. IIIV-5B TaxID=2321230 RepID=UPI001F25FB19|nr:hypothetical protein [Halococcus sp. IIIV-5B]
MITAVLLQLLPPVPNAVKWVGALLAPLAAVIAAYKFLIQRPQLRLITGDKTDRMIDNQVRSVMRFNILNSGLGLAENAYVQFALDDWNFRGTGEKEPADDEGTNTGIQLSESILETRHNDTYYIGTRGEVDQIFIDDVLHMESEFQLFWGTVTLERFQTYTFEYSVACRTHGMKSGRITFHSGYDDITVTHTPPKFWWGPIAKAIKRLRGAKLPLNVKSEQDVWIESEDIEEESAPNSSNIILRPVATVRASSTDSKLMTVIAKATLYMGEKINENIVGTITHTAQSLQWDETWETRYPAQNRRRATTHWESDIERFSLDPPIEWSSDLEPYPSEPKEQLHVEWSVDHLVSQDKDPRGLEISESELINVDTDEEGQSPIRIEGVVENENVRDESIFVIAKFCTGEDLVLTTNHNRVQIDGGNTADFRIRAGLSPEQESRIRDCDLVTRRDLG